MATQTQEAVAHGADAAGHVAANVGMPQLDISTFSNQIFWLVVTLVLIYMLLSRVALPRIGSVLAERRGMITSDIAAAEELKEKASEAEQAYQKALTDARSEAARIIAEAKAEIAKDLQQATARADEELAVKAAEAEKRISAIRASALESVTLVARDTAEAVVAAFGGAVDAKAVETAVATRLKG